MAGIPVQRAAGVVEATAFMPAQVASAARPAEILSPVATWLRLWGLHVEVMAAFTAGAVFAFMAASSPLVGLMALAMWTVANYLPGRAITTPVTRQLRRVVLSAAVPLAGVAALVGFLEVSPARVPEAFAAVGAASAVCLVSRVLRWRLQGPVRVMVAGDRVEIASVVSRWAKVPEVHVVGGLVAEAGLAPEMVPHEILGVPTKAGLEGSKGFIKSQQADLVLVRPGAELDETAFRRLTWDLAGTRCAVGVSGVMTSVASHRLTPGGLAGMGVVAVGPPRPSTVVRGVKRLGDRVLGALILVAVSPILALAMLAVVLETPGPAIFRQTRIGRGGGPFTLLKLRTMENGAEEAKTGLADQNESDGVLFKMREDPRVTKVGAFLRKYSLDELPQLVNVVRGEMSLVGPRPHLPEEVERMREDDHRRHVVQPGLTGLWQVSGRSDLPEDLSRALDTYYADNWSLTGDAFIMARTVKAVFRGNGAY